MCGRYALFAEKADIIKAFNIKNSLIMKPRYNIAPSQMVPVVTAEGPFIHFARWSFLPSWTKLSGEDEAKASGYINARSETIHEKPAFKQSFLKRRCLIPASGYYEWQTIQKQKFPFFISATDQPLFAFAGIWSYFQTSQWENLMTCAILTKPAQESLTRIHHRMPVIIPPEDYHDWLNKNDNQTALHDMLQLSDDINLQPHPVSKQVNSPANDSPVCIKSL